MLVSLPATWDWISFLTIKKSATLRIPLAYVFSIYLLFVAGTVGVYGLRMWRIFRNQDEAAQAGQGQV
jgi:TRAP-type C4-dicarboxylate transport system permease small subunit